MDDAGLINLLNLRTSITCLIAPEKTRRAAHNQSRIFNKVRQQKIVIANRDKSPREQSFQL